MTLRELACKIEDYGTDPVVLVERQDGKNLDCGKPGDVARRSGGMQVESFIATACGELRVFVSMPE